MIYVCMIYSTYIFEELVHNDNVNALKAIYICILKELILFFKDFQKGKTTLHFIMPTFHGHVIPTVYNTLYFPKLYNLSSSAEKSQSIAQHLSILHLHNVPFQSDPLLLSRWPVRVLLLFWAFVSETFKDGLLFQATRLTGMFV